MYFCLNCKNQFNDGMARNGNCPYCGVTNFLAKQRCDLERFTLTKNSDKIKEIINSLKLKHGIKILHEHD